MEALPEGQIRFLVHGSDSTSDELVSASVFATKLATLVRALKAADTAKNGKPKHDYKIKKLESSSPTALLVETALPVNIEVPLVISSPSNALMHFQMPSLAAGESGINGFSDCVDAIVAGERERALRYGRCAAYVGALSQGANKSFGYAEIWTSKKTPVRVDPFLNERSRAIIGTSKTLAAPIGGKWFTGIADGSFDGTILEVDLRGSLPELKLVLTAGSQEIDCVCRSEDIESIRRSLNHRVQVFGRAIYDGKTGLPRRIEVTNIEPLTGTGNLEAWKGAFEPFEPSFWEDDE